MGLSSARLEGLALLMVTSLWILGSGPAVTADVENVARGGDFEDAKDLQEWDLDVADGSIAEMKIDKANAAIGKTSLFFEAVALSGNDGTRPRFNQFGHIVEEGKTYTLSAFYKAEEKRMVSMTVQLNGVPWTRFTEKAIVIDTEWKEEWTTFTSPLNGEVSIQPTRNNGSLVNYWVDGVRFFEGEYEPYLPDQAVSRAGKLAVKWAAIKALR